MKQPSNGGRRAEPFVIDAADLPPADDAGPAEAPPLDDDFPQGEAMIRVARFAARPRSRGWLWFWSVLGSLVSTIVSIAAYDYVMGLLERSPTLGFVVMGLMILLAVIVVGQVFRELWAFRSLARIDQFRIDAAAALASPVPAEALNLSRRLENFYASRPELRWSSSGLAEQREGLVDGDAILALTERALFAPLDIEARVEIENASRTVAAATALIPLAMMDVLAALSSNMRMIRRIAEIYGAHSGFFGSWRLFGTVATHLIATGAVAAGDDLVHSVLGGSVLAKLSRRFGEGVVNGALTARVGIAAMEVCRPLPFDALPKPKVSNILGRSMSGLFQKAD